MGKKKEKWYVGSFTHGCLENSGEIKRIAENLNQEVAESMYKQLEKNRKDKYVAYFLDFE